MAKFNEGTKGATKTINKAGGAAYKMGAKEMLVTQVLTSFMNEAKYYGDNSKQIVENIRHVLDVDPRFIASLAVYAREQFYMRSIAHVLVAELAHAVKGEAYVRQAIVRVCQRPDDMKEILAYYLGTHGKPIPNILKKGLAEAFAGFDEYQLAKYNAPGAVKLKDILCIAHPKPSTKAQAELWSRVLGDTLQTPYTWETELSAKGNKAEVWEQLINSKKLPYMAMLRNLRNIFQSKAANADDILTYIANPAAVANSKQLPFRFMSAHRELQNAGVMNKKVSTALEMALRHSLGNIEKLKGKTMIIADNSGSMGSALSERSSVSYADVANLMLAIGDQICEESILSIFATDFKVLSSTNAMSSIFDTIEKIKTINVGYSTNLHLPMEYLLNTGTSVDRIIILSDMQAYTASFGQRNFPAALATYRAKINPNVFVHSIDLAGYGTSQAPTTDSRVNLIAGWSDKVLGFIGLMEQDRTQLINVIANYL